MNKEIIYEIREWEKIWVVNISLGARDDLIKRIKLLIEGAFFKDKTK